MRTLSHLAILSVLSDWRLMILTDMRERHWEDADNRWRAWESPFRRAESSIFELNDFFE
jgi:hypothetical protein